MIRGENHNGDESKYAYNALGTLVGRETITATGTHTNDFVIDYTSFVPTVLAEYSSDNIVQRHVYGNSLARISTTLTQGNNTETFFIQNDRLGTGHLATNADGVRVGHTQLDEWGAVLERTMPTFNGQQVDILNQFTNHTFDDILGIYHAQARFYDPNTRRFISADPHWSSANRIYGDFSAGIVPDLSAIQQSANLYSYVGNNPLKYIDPDGRRYLVANGQIRELNTLTSNGFVEINELIGVLNSYGINSSVQHTNNFMHRNYMHGNVGNKSFAINVNDNTGYFLSNALQNANTHMRRNNPSINRISGYFPVFMCDTTSAIYVDIRRFLPLAGLSNIVEIFRPSIHGEGFEYSTLDDALLAFSIIYGERTRETGNEFGAHIISTLGTAPTYVITDVREGHGSEVMLSPIIKERLMHQGRSHEASIHTHPDGNLFTGRRRNEIGLVSGDGNVAGELNVPIYLTAPNGTILRLDPKWATSGGGRGGRFVDEIPYWDQHVKETHNNNRGAW
jgi:RHS repeat-associated protein